MTSVGAKRMAHSADGGRLGLSANGMYSFASSNVPPTTNLSPEDLDLICLCFTLGAGTIANPLPTTVLSTSLGTPQALPSPKDPSLTPSSLSNAAYTASSIIGGGTRRDGPIQSAQAVPKTGEATLKYVSKVFAFLSELGEWEIEFKTIKVETSHAFHIHFAVLEIKYQYLTLIYVTHFLLTVCYAIPITQASDETKASIWSWSVTGNKTAHSVLELWNKFVGAMSKSRGKNASSTSGSGRRQDSTPSASNLTCSPTSLFLSLHLRRSPHVHTPKTHLALKPPKLRSSPSL
ncbi:hypothetical protein M422DRAFT_267744 [Sphaerobolus stellatus SS14]|uniref:Uncharacterized protein n=1 Tax=Sphaerobolus stellatus (strain SS14) TaxID=990650 RepID=A0A0C9U8D5_SPHS4|nr:hypothetical protein M422DRAFT_267744 [Sphaerobolus stellatus SS14]